MIRGEGRPLRFLALLVAGWIGIRAAMLWPYAEAVPGVAPVIAPPARHTQTAAAPLAMPINPVSQRAAWRAAAATPKRDASPVVWAGSPISPDARRARPAETPVLPPLLPGLPIRAAPAAPPGSAAAAAPWQPPRLSGSFWLVARGGAGVTSAPLGGQLGGSQAGLRLAYLLDRKHRVAVMARVTSPLGTGLREAAVGVEWQPTRLPVRIVAEQRIAIDGGKGGPAVGVVGGFGPLPVGAGFRLESYAQAGAIHRDRTEGFVDGAAHVSHPLATIGAIPIDLGAGLWGGAQRGAERLDVGPSISATLPIAKQRLRVSLDWRERVAGQAQPGSGVALTLGADF